MRSIFSNKLESFANIYSKDIELVCMAHPQSSYLDTLGKKFSTQGRPRTSMDSISK